MTIKERVRLIAGISGMKGYEDIPEEELSDGLGEMPEEVADALKKLVRWTITKDTGYLNVNRMHWYESLAQVAFLMGRKFGWLERDESWESIAEAVPMLEG